MDRGHGPELAPRMLWVYCKYLILWEGISVLSIAGVQGPIRGPVILCEVWKSLLCQM